MPSITSTLDPQYVSPRYHRQDSLKGRHRGLEHHIIPDNPLNTVISLKGKKDLEPTILNVQPYSAPIAIAPSNTALMSVLCGPSGKDFLSEQTESIGNKKKSKRFRVFDFGVSEDESCLRANIQRPPKQAAVKEEAGPRVMDDQRYFNDVFETGDQSAIDDDDDSSDWEDTWEGMHSSYAANFFRRIDSCPRQSSLMSLQQTRTTRRHGSRAASPRSVRLAMIATELGDMREEILLARQRLPVRSFDPKRILTDHDTI